MLPQIRANAYTVENWNIAASSKSLVYIANSMDSTLGQGSVSWPAAVPVMTAHIRQEARMDMTLNIVGIEITRSNQFILDGGFQGIRFQFGSLSASFFPGRTKSTQT
mmetsp:Transcript_98532/g.306813  ORF Transcript_98532/g.306813 Transcript_98532/m.306813 type:complete len:107 (+) Transcript_98532:1294-1614(+)